MEGPRGQSPKCPSHAALPVFRVALLLLFIANLCQARLSELDGTVIMIVCVREFQPGASPKLKITSASLTGELIARLFLMLKRLK